MTLLVWPLLVLASISLLFWGLVGLRVLGVLRERPTVREGLELANSDEPAPSVSIVVPVHNEERVIDDCARSLRAQNHASLEMIFVLDRCTDASAEILSRHAGEDARITVVENDSCPDDWAGKCNAARLGADRARGDYVLFTDADTGFDPDLVRATVAIARSESLALLSLLSTLTTEHRFERIVQPVASMNLVRMYPINRVNRADNARPFANGQFMLFERRAYDDIGGHGAVKDALLEDIAFARTVHAAGHRVGIRIADGMLTCSMYDSLAAFRTGWKRIFIEACKRKPGRMRKNAYRVLGMGIGMPAVKLLGLVIGAALTMRGAGAPAIALTIVAASGLALQFASLMVVHRLCSAPMLTALLHPAGAWIVGRIMLSGARDLEQRRPIPWAGREYVLEPR